MKQITAMVQIAITLEVPNGMTTEAIKDMIKNNTSWDVTCDTRDIVEVSDILAIDSITEATID